MKTPSIAMQAHLASSVTTLTLCWRVVRTDGVLILGTVLDKDVAITVVGTPDLSGVYLAGAGITGSTVASSSDMSVDNMEVTGGLNEGDLSLLDLSAADIEAGLLDNAEVTLFTVNWQDPDDDQIIVRYGTLGNLQRSTDENYTAELRGITQKLTQPVTDTYSTTCTVKEFGDARCGKDISGMILEVTVTAVSTRRRFDVSGLDADSPVPPARRYAGGKLIGLTGNNTGYAREIRRAAVGDILGDLDLLEPFPLDVEIGDTFTIKPGCDRELSTCRDDYDNVLRFRGYGVFTPGLAKMIKGPDRGDGPV